jgi:signal transduction histidine kinase
MESIQNQVDNYLLKPIQTTTLVPVLSKILKKIKLEVENKEYKNNLKQLVKSQVLQIEKQNKIIYQQSKLAAMGEMIDSIAHQWKQPLSVISISVQGLQISKEIYGEVSDESLDEYSNTIKLQIEHLLSTMDEFRNFFRPDIDTQEVVVKDIIDSVLILLNDDIVKNNINIKIIGDTDLTINIIPNEFKHILINIINNAKDAFKNITYKKVITIDISKIETSIIFNISDNAGGISLDAIDHIFEPNFTTKETESGTGIGLYMSKMIIEKVNGSLSVKNISKINSDNKTILGAVFTLEIPTS